MVVLRRESPARDDDGDDELSDNECWLPFRVQQRRLRAQRMHGLLSRSLSWTALKIGKGGATSRTLANLSGKPPERSPRRRRPTRELSKPSNSERSIR